MNPAMNPALNRLAAIIDEHRSMAEALDAVEIDALACAMMDAERIFFSGQGRSGHMTRALAVRLMHIGLTVYVAGEPSAPAIGAKDLLIAVSASAGTKATLEHIRVARGCGAKVALISAKKRDSGIAGTVDIADLYLTIPARSVVSTVQHAGSLFEQTVLLLGDAIAWHIQQKLGVDDRLLNERHANLQ
jgi:6-phospho-3-hexuloisomerase